jgi:alkanesulfonate monooxygenase SsuD/methylene tetrahydromethanopterin reductase-like flavin-dependent oxidoreductase (luciferase family)
MFGVLAYVSPHEIPPGWPVPPVYYDRETGHQSLHHGLEQAEFADQLGFDWVSFSEHHYSTMSVAPHPALTAAAVANRVRRARIALLGHVLPLNNPIRIAEELAILDNLCGGRLVVGLLRGTPNEYQAYGVNPAETRDRMTEGMELILKAWTEPQPFGWEGRYYQYRTVSVWPRPLQQPHPPTYALGTTAEAGEFAARNHVGLGVSFAPYEVMAK